MSSSSSTTRFNTGPWSNEEHQNFLRGVAAHGCGNWTAIGVLVRTRNPQQIEVHAGQHFAQSAEEQGLARTEAISTSGVGAVGGGTAAAPSSALGIGVCYFSNGSVLHDWAGVL